jgi:hypothetical protein
MLVLLCSEVFDARLSLKMLVIQIIKALSVSAAVVATAACLQASLFTAQPLCDSCHIFYHMLVLL